MIVDILKNNLSHHAYLIEGDRKDILPKLFDDLEKGLNIKTKGNPDFFYQDFETFGIDDSRRLKEEQYKKAVVSNKHIFVISFNIITHQAQNALLKIFEEPTPDTIFFIITPSIENLLPTLKSRLFIIGENPSIALGGDLVKKFLESSKPRRLILIKKMVENKDKNEAFVLLNQLESRFYELGGPVASLEKEEFFVLKEIIQAKKYLAQQGSSLKKILEHIALITPRIS